MAGESCNLSSLRSKLGIHSIPQGRKQSPGEFECQLVTGLSDDREPRAPTIFVLDPVSPEFSFMPTDVSQELAYNLGKLWSF